MKIMSKDKKISKKGENKIIQGRDSTLKTFDYNSIN